MYEISKLAKKEVNKVNKHKRMKAMEQIRANENNEIIVHQKLVPHVRQKSAERSSRSTGKSAFGAIIKTLITSSPSVSESRREMVVKPLSRKRVSSWN